MDSALTTAAGRELIEAFVPYDDATAMTLISRLRADPRWIARPDLVSEAATQARLRTRAATRFPGPPRWWTPDGLEQATRPLVARRHAHRFAAAGIDRVWDLGCGAGSDSLALAAAGIEVTAVDRDTAALAALQATAHDWGLTLRTRAADVTDLALDHHAACFVDPARRNGGTRTLDPRAWSPPWPWVVDLAPRVRALGAKVAPGLDHGQIPPDAQAEWTSVDGTLVEAAIWCGEVRGGPATRIATVLVGDREDSLHDIDGVPVPSVAAMAGWLVEPASAVIRAGLVTVLASRLGAWQVDPRIAYLSTDRTPEPGLLGTRYEVIAQVPFARRALRAWLVRRGYGDVIVKKRGVGIVPEELRAALRLRGGGPTATLVLTRTDAGPMAWAVRPC